MVVTMTDRVAGHQFEGIGSDQRCTLGECQRWWADIMNCSDDDVGKADLAHTGNLSSHELTQIIEKRKHELRFWEAVELAAK